MEFRRSETEVVPIRTQRVPQTIETPVTFVQVPGGYVRYAYARSSDSMASQIEGQDYLCFQHNDQRLVFVVCDGVGSSFCGNLAARILGDRLLEWLWLAEVPRMGGAGALMETATSYLQRIQREAQLEVEDYEIPDTISGLVRQALESQRAYGSEAIFVAARIDHPSPTIPEGLISVFWMGDTRVRVLDETGQPFELGGSWENANRWSTVQGVRGSMSAWMESLKGVGRIVAFSDGLSAHTDRLLDYSDDKLDREIRAGSRLPTSDDVSFIDVVIRTARYEGYADPDMPDFTAERPHLEQIWNPTGAPAYELRWNWPGHPKARFMLQEATNPALADARVIDIPMGSDLSWKPSQEQKPGHYYYRVRAINRRGIVSPWSELRQTRVAYPPPPAPKLEATEPGRAAGLNWSEEGEALDYELEKSATPEFEQPQVVYTGRGTNWTVADRTPGVTYYRVRAISDGGSGPWSKVQEVEITLPPPPKPHLGSASHDYADVTSYQLRWQPVPGATRYELEELNQDSEEVEVFDLTEENYRVEGQSVGNYVYRVRACHDYGCSEWSNEQLVIISPQAPAHAPELTLDGPDQNDLLILEWDEIEEAALYIVEVSEEADFNNARVYTQQSTTLELVRREPGMTYVRVCATNAGGDGPWSNVASLSLVPNPPAWIEVDLSEDKRQVSLAWGAVGGHPDYRLEQLQGEAYAEIYHGEDTQFKMNVPAGDNLTFRVRAEVSGVESDWQASDPIYIQPVLGIPKLELPKSGEQGELTLNWEPVDGASHYILEVARDEHFTSPRTVQVDQPKAGFRPPAGGRYYFRVRAYRDTQQGPPSNVITYEASQMAAPRLWPLDPVKAHNIFEISWTGVPGSSYYELQESRDGAFKAGKVRSIRVFHPGQKAAVPGYPAGQYHYRVRAVDEADQPSAWSEALTVEVIN